MREIIVFNVILKVIFLSLFFKQPFFNNILKNSEVLEEGMETGP